jgi:hypothetical protein
MIDLANLPATTGEIDLLDEVGEQGWELIAIMSNHVAYLRRPIDDPVRAPKASPRRKKTPRQGLSTCPLSGSRH